MFDCLPTPHRYRYRQVLSELIRQGIAEPSDRRGRFRLTAYGLRLADARATTPVRRDTAAKCLVELLRRVAEVNADPSVPYVVDRVAVFGSFLSGQPRVGDLDVAVRLAPRHDDPTTFQRLANAYAEECLRTGAVPSRMPWWLVPMEAVMRRIKGGRRTVSLHMFQEVEEFGYEFVDVYDRRRGVLEEVVARLIGT